MTFGETWTRETAAYGGFADAIGGLATIVLAILGLSGLFPLICCMSRRRSSMRSPEVTAYST